MSSLYNTRILLGVTGGIAAYKSAELIRRLKESGADVRVVMTPAALEFITPLTLQALSGNPVHTELLDPEAEAGMGHIELAKWADLILIAPASADAIARIDKGLGNDLLTTLCLASNATIAIAPAMNQAMWSNQNTQNNVDSLISKGVKVFGPGSGSQACGDIGLGRMLEPQEIADLCSELFQPLALNGKHVLITAGPTREAIDPVRYISNHSSGKMGYALAEAAINAGAKVTLISGPVNIGAPERASLIKVNSAQEMLDACNTHAAHCDIFIGSAAVADYRPTSIATEKIKKNDEQMSIALVKNPDIISTIANNYNNLYMVGFAAETNDVVNYAKSKLEKKKLDIIVANDVSDKTIGFNSDDNEVYLIDSEGARRIEKCSKKTLAIKIINAIAEKIK